MTNNLATLYGERDVFRTGLVLATDAMERFVSVAVVEQVREGLVSMTDHPVEQFAVWRKNLLPPGVPSGTDPAIYHRSDPVFWAGLVLSTDVMERFVAITIVMLARKDLAWMTDHGIEQFTIRRDAFAVGKPPYYN